MIRRKPIQYQRSFVALNEFFEEQLRQFDPIQNALPIEDFFGKDIGVKGSLKKLHKNKIIDDLEDFQGLYLFIEKENNLPFYVGISQKVVSRLQQHIKGRSHFSASLAYRIGLEEYRRKHPQKTINARGDLDFDNIKEAQEVLRDQKVSIYKMDDPTELYLFEVFCAMKFGTPYNDFRTH